MTPTPDINLKTSIQVRGGGGTTFNNLTTINYHKDINVVINRNYNYNKNDEGDDEENDQILYPVWCVRLPVRGTVRSTAKSYCEEPTLSFPANV